MLLTVFGPLSGAHFNPAVTLYFARGDTACRTAVLYMPTQFVAATLGVWLAQAKCALPALEVSRHLRDGPAQSLSEFVARTGLLLTIAGGVRFASLSTPMLVALYITGAYWFTDSASFANPAVTIALKLYANETGYLVKRLIFSAAIHRSPSLRAMSHPRLAHG